MRLEQWLDTATYGLMPEARERIRREVRGHIAIAVADGVIEVDAVKQLGSPEKARRRYGRQYLTSEQFLSLQEDLSRANANSKFNMGLQMFTSLVTVFLLCFVLTAGIRGYWSGALGMCGFVVIGIECGKMSPLALLSRRVEVSAILKLASHGMSFLACWIIAREEIPTYSDSILLLGAGVVACFAVIEFQKVRTLRKNIDVLDFLCLQPQLTQQDLYRDDL